MKYKYAVHPRDYALGEMEKFYGDMEARGWRLVKRGAYLSKFEPAEPSRARYRVEIVVPGILDQPAMSEEQLAVYDDCGWEYVTDRGVVYIFRAPEGSDAPEFYMEPQQQAATLKALKRRNRWGMAICWLVLLLNVPLLFANKTASQLGAEIMMAWVENTALVLLYGWFILGALAAGFYESWRFDRLYRQMKKGVPLDHAPRDRRWPRLCRWGHGAMMALLAVLLAAQWLGTETRDLPQTADGPYLLLEDLSHTGDRGHLFYDDRTSRVEMTRSLLADHWDVFEVVEQGDGQTWMYQDVYRLRRAAPMDFARTLMETAVFARSAEDFVPVEAQGLDAAWLCGDLELVAVKGDLVIYAESLTPGYQDDGHLRAMLPALAARWESLAA